MKSPAHLTFSNKHFNDTSPFLERRKKGQGDEGGIWAKSNLDSSVALLP